MKTFFLTVVVLCIVTVLFCFSSITYSEGQNKVKRGDEPQCQNACLKEHSEKMSELEKSLSKTGNKLAYQNQVEEEENRYARCLTNCRELVPIK